MTRVAIRPEMIRWARVRAGFGDPEPLLARFPKLFDWESGEVQPTLRQIEAYANAVHAPIGFLFLDAPPDEPLPIPDFRTVAGMVPRRPGPDLLDTVYAAQERQNWYRDFARLTRQAELAFVGSARVTDAPAEVAAQIARTLTLDSAARAACRDWEAALRQLLNQADAVGILVMISGIVGSNTHRTLNPEEFRGFALSDNAAPLVFVNGADSKSGQMFTLAHELAHVWLGTSAVSDAGAAPIAGYRREEVWCNAVAAELLVPLDALRAALIARETLGTALPRLSRMFKVSNLVMLRRLLDVGFLSRAAFDAAWAMENARLQALKAKRESGGDFYRSTLTRVSKRFARALIESTLEGQTLYRDAFRLLGVKSNATFNEIGRQAGVMA
jgi:Zn-dependent peptidase ImmA (M78 family)